MPSDGSRRLFLQWSAATAGMWLSGRTIALSPGRVEALTRNGTWPLLDLADFSQPLPEHWVTPTADFYVQSAFTTPEIKAEQWQLKLSGLLNNPLALSLAELQAKPEEDRYWTLECIGNQAGGELLGNARWQGTPLLPILQRVGVKPEATAFALRAADGYETGVLREELMHEDVLLAYGMNGEPLSPERGYPLRILIPGKYGQKQPKWITEIEAISEPIKGHWERQGWSDRANVLTHALTRQVQQERVSIRNRHLDAPAGWVAIAGMALASLRGIDRVEVSRDSGTTWQVAEQTHPPTPYEWTLWRHRWQFPPGHYQLLARAIAGQERQPLDDIIPFDGNQAVLKLHLEVR